MNARSPELAPTLLARLRTIVDEALLYSHTPPKEEARLRELAIRQTARTVRPLQALAAVAVLLWWPFDLLLYGDRPDVLSAFATWRGGVLVYCLVYSYTCDRWAVTRRHFAKWGTLLGSLIALVIASSLGSLGSSAAPWFASLYFVPVMTFPFLVTLPVRLAGASTVGAVSLVGFFTARPSGVSDDLLGTAIGLMAFSVMMSVCVGHAIYHLNRRQLLQSEVLAERTRELERYSSGLTVQIAERNAELSALASHVEDLRERERRAFARDLHDELGQLLTGLRMGLDVAEKVRARGGDLRPELQRLLALLDATLVSTRSMIAHLRPRILDDFGLVAALEWLVEDTRARTEVDIRLAARPDDFEVSGDVATAVFRVVQESVTNALRHARASVIAVDIELDGDRLTTTITDDGVGLPPVEARRTSSMGLIGMRERALALGGMLDVASPPKGGTHVRLRLPQAQATLAPRVAAPIAEGI